MEDLWRELKIRVMTQRLYNLKEPGACQQRHIMRKLVGTCKKLVINHKTDWIMSLINIFPVIIYKDYWQIHISY